MHEHVRARPPFKWIGALRRPRPDTVISVRCLLMAPSTTDLAVLLSVLHEQGVEVRSTSDLGAGAALGQVSFDQTDCGVAVVPSSHDDRTVGLPAVYVEIGVAVGRGLPLLVIVEPPAPPSPALSGLATVSTAMDNAKALRLHLGLFLRSVRATPARPPSQPAASTTVATFADYQARLDAIRSAPRGRRGSRLELSLEQLVSDLLRDAGAIVEDRTIDGPDLGIDIVAFVPGQERSLGTILVEVKSRLPTHRDFQTSQEKLSEYVLHSRSGLGLLIYDEAAIDQGKPPSSPLVLSLSIDELLTQFEQRPLSTVLARARNRAVHGM